MAGDRPDWLRATTIESDFQSIVLGDATKAVSYPFTANHSVAGVFVSFTSPTNNTVIRLQLSVTNVTKSITFPGVDVLAFTDAGGLQTPGTAIVPAISAPGDSLQLNVQVIGLGNAWTISAWSMTQLPGAVQFRRDLRPYPMGVFSFNSTGILGSTVVASPGARRRILLGSLMVQVSSGAGNQAILEVQGTIGGSGLTVGIAAAPVASSNEPQAPTQIPEQGLLFDPNTALTTFMGGAAASAVVAGTYDVVT